MKRATIRRFTLALGILALVAVVCSQVFVQSTSKFSKKAKTEETADHEEEQYFSVPSSSLPSSAHVELNRDVFFLFETLLSEKETDETKDFPNIQFGRLFEILIGSFISPNAP
jgi:hypothetical protein